MDEQDAQDTRTKTEINRKERIERKEKAGVKKSLGIQKEGGCVRINQWLTPRADGSLSHRTGVLKGILEG